MKNQNYVADRSIQTVYEMACAMMLHLSLCCKMALVQTCGQWLLVMPAIFTITCPILSTSCLLISLLELNLPVTSLNISTCWFVLSMSWILHSNKVINSQNVSHDLIALYLLDSVQMIQVMFLLSSTQLLAISTHNLV